MIVWIASIFFATATSLLFPVSAPSNAVAVLECAKHQTAQQAGILKTRRWSEFRKTECGGNAAIVKSDRHGAAVLMMPVDADEEVTSSIKVQENTDDDISPATGDVVFPSAISEQYSDESPRTARMLTCLDQYRANKATGGNGGLKWIGMNNGYYKQCNNWLAGR